MTTYSKPEWIVKKKQRKQTHTSLRIYRYLKLFSNWQNTNKRGKLRYGRKREPKRVYNKRRASTLPRRHHTQNTFAPNISQIPDLNTWFVSPHFRLPMSPSRSLIILLCFSSCRFGPSRKLVDTRENETWRGPAFLTLGWRLIWPWRIRHWRLGFRLGVWLVGIDAGCHRRKCNYGHCSIFSLIKTATVFFQSVFFLFGGLFSSASFWGIR